MKFACLPAEYSQGLILPQRGSKQAPVQQKMVGVRTKRENSLPTSTSVSPASKPSGKGFMSVSSLVLRLLCEPRSEHGRWVQGSMPGTNVTFLHGHCVEHVGFSFSFLVTGC